MKFLQGAIEMDIFARSIRKNPFVLERVTLEIAQPEWNYFRFNRTSPQPDYTTRRVKEVQFQ